MGFSSGLTAQLGRQLFDLVEEDRRQIAALVFGPSEGTPQAASLAGSLFFNGFLDRLSGEAQSGDASHLEGWLAAAGETDPEPHERARLAILTCAAVASAFTARHGPSDRVLHFLTLRGSELASLIEKHRVSAKPGKLADPSKLVSKDEVVSSLLAAIEARDPLTCEHSRAVGVWCGRIAKALGLRRDLQDFAVLCGTLHDVGKIATPKRILAKPGPLTDEEWIDMRAHSEEGEKLLVQIPSLKELAPIVRAHHERMDGRGYPDRLKGDDIPLMARVVAVADAFHAMISKRPYRDAMPASVAIDVLREGRGTQWDPVVVDAMLQIVRPVTTQPRLRIVKQNAG